jgi:hypothetical protein
MTNTETTRQFVSPTLEDPRLAFESFLPLAQALPEAEVEVCRAEVPIVRVNASRGVDAILPRIAEIIAKQPDLVVGELLEVKPLALALVYADDRIPLANSQGEIAERLGRVRMLRELTLQQLEIFGALGLVPADRVRAIRAGTGPLDTARDAVAITGMFVEFAEAVSGKHPFTPEHFTTLSTEGSWLVRELQPQRAIRVKDERDGAAVIRDRLWTLLQRRYEALREAAVVLFGLRRLDEYVPLLQARQVAARTPSPTPPSPPSPPTPPTTGNTPTSSSNQPPRVS